MTTSIYEFSSALEFLKAYLAGLKNEGFGEASKIAKALGVHPSVVTGILKGKTQLSVDQAMDLADYIGLDEAQASFLVLLVQYERTEKPSLQRLLDRQIERARLDSKKVKRHLSERTPLTQEMAQEFYSQWYYSGLRMLVDADASVSVDDCAKRLDLPKATVQRVLEFLLKHSLLMKDKEGLRLGPTKTHLVAEDPLVARHHLNWREKAQQHIHNTREYELHFTGPMALSHKDFETVRNILLASIQESFKIVDKSKSETPACLLIDLFRF